MNINDLKIGDKVKYFQNGYTILDSKISEIVTIEKNLTKYIAFKNGDWCYPENIISKLEPILDPMTSNKIPISYIETPIEHGNNYGMNNYGICQCCGMRSNFYLCNRCSEIYPRKTMNFEELRIGDKVRHYYPEWISIGEGEITRIDGLYITINQTVVINKDLIICKLEDNYIKGFPAQYKEIPIEKETFLVHSFCCPTCHKGYSINGNFTRVVEQECDRCKEKKDSGRYYICQQCKSSTFIKENTELDREKFLNYICDKCKKEKFAPKSLKFDFNTRNTVGDSFQPFYDYRDGKSMNGFTEYKEKAWGNIKIPMPFWAELNKTYTIEIKEKE